MIISIESREYGMALQVDKDKRLRHSYFGKKLKNSEEYACIGSQLRYDEPDQSVWNHAYTPCGTWNIVEPAFHAVHADGNASTELRYVSHQTKRIAASVYQTTILLVDAIYKTRVALYYKVYQKQNVFEQWSVTSLDSRN